MGKATYEYGYQFGVQPGQPSPVYKHMKHYIFSKTLHFETKPDERVEVIDKNEVVKYNIERSFEWKTFEMRWAQPPTIERLGGIQTKTLFIIGTEEMKDNLHTAELFG